MVTEFNSANPGKELLRTNRAFPELPKEVTPRRPDPLLPVERRLIKQEVVFESDFMLGLHDGEDVNKGMPYLDQLNQSVRLRAGFGVLEAEEQGTDNLHEAKNVATWLMLTQRG